MASYKYQLVFQFAATTLAEFDALIALMEAIEVSIISSHVDAVVDGHDVGRGEFNIFIHTNDPKALFVEVGKIVGTLQPALAFAAGYRAFNDDAYTSLYPRSNTTFTVS